MMKKKIARGQSQTYLDEKERGEDIGQAHRGEPHLVGPEHARFRREGTDQDNDDDDPDPEPPGESTKAPRALGNVSGTSHGDEPTTYLYGDNSAGTARVQRRVRRTLGKFSPARRSPASESCAHRSHGASLVLRKTEWTVPWRR